MKNGKSDEDDEVLVGITGREVKSKKKADEVSLKGTS